MAGRKKGFGSAGKRGHGGHTCGDRRRYFDWRFAALWLYCVIEREFDAISGRGVPMSPWWECLCECVCVGLWPRLMRAKTMENKTPKRKFWRAPRARQKSSVGRRRATAVPCATRARRAGASVFCHRGGMWICTRAISVAGCRITSGRTTGMPSRSEAWDTWTGLPLHPSQ
jgi:hypothetical protein